MSARRSLTAPAFLAALALSLALAAAGCAGKHPPVATGQTPTTTAQKAGEPEPPTIAPGGGRALPGYERRVESLQGLDTSALRGRRIAIDPGHGGRFPGSIGTGGLTEAEVNLGVALHLWGLLTDAGAEVLLTRTADRDFTTALDSSLRTDLAGRVAKANAFHPELFLSIHHNADAGSRHDLNETQTYYKFTDPEASYDLGRTIHRHLALNLGVGADRLLPGNYFVLRNAEGAAVLGESSYLTNPLVESRLALAAKQRLEAEAYYLGLADYFRQGVPRILATRVDPVTTGDDPRDGSERPWLMAMSDRQPGAARLVVDGVLADSARFEFHSLSSSPTWVARWRPLTPFTDGLHRVEWAVRAAGGNWSNVRRDSFEIDLPIARTELVASPSGGGLAPGQVVGLTLRALDRHGRAVADTVRARFVARVGAAIVDSLGGGPAPGEARAYARLTGGSVAEFSATPLRPRVRAELADATARVTLAAPGNGAHAISGFVRTADGRPVAGARVRGGAADSVFALTNADGFFALAVPPGADAPTAEAPGYVTAAGASAASSGLIRLRLLPIGGGALLGRRIAIDPAGGGADTTGMLAGMIPIAPEPVTPTVVPSDTSAVNAVFDTTLDRPLTLTTPGDTLAARRAQAIEANANLRVAQALRANLEAAGARVVLTRERPDSLTAIDRLRVTEGFGAERLLSIAHRAPAGTASAGHYFSSAAGKALAQRIATRLDARGVARRARVVESPSYLVQQTAAIAVAVNAPDVRAEYADSARGERRLREEAYALYLALLEDLGGDPKSFLTLPVAVTRGARPSAGVPVQLDGRWTLITGPEGRVTFDGLPAGAVVTVSGVAPAAPVRVVLPAPAGVTIALPDSTAASTTGSSPR